MLHAITKTDVGLHLDDSDRSNEIALLSLRTEELSLRFEEMTITQLQQEREATEREIRRHNGEIERLRMQFDEDRKVREHAEKMRRLELDENDKARLHELKPEVQEMLRLKLELAKLTENVEKLKYEDNRHERDHKERMAAREAERLDSAEKIKRQRVDERRIAIEEKQKEINELRNRCERLERQLRKAEEQDIRNIRNLRLVATGVGAATGAIRGALGTAASVGLAPGVLGAATVMSPVAGTVAILSGAGYVYKKTASTYGA